MLTLGINQDLYDCGVALADGRDVLYSANEEKCALTRIDSHFLTQEPLAIDLHVGDRRTSVIHEGGRRHYDS